MTAKLPGATWDPISGRSTLSNKPVRMTVHIAVSRSKDIYGPGKGPGGTYAHFYNPKSGSIRQHQEINRRTYADLEGNGSTVSVEHEGWPGDKMTPSQIDNNARLFAHLVKHYGVPNRVATWNDTRGLAWHRLGCQGNFGRFSKNNRKTWSTAQTGVKWSTAFGKTCPTDNFIDQIDDIYRRAQSYIKGETPSTPSKPKPPRPSKPGGGGKLPKTYKKLRVDGHRGPVTNKAWKVLLGAIDQFKIGRDNGKYNGDWGRAAILAEQRWLAGLGRYKGRIDGIRGPVTKKSLQEFLRYDKGLYSGWIDGDEGPLTVKAEQRYLNDQRQYLK